MKGYAVGSYMGTCLYTSGVLVLPISTIDVASFLTFHFATGSSETESDKLEGCFWEAESLIQPCRRQFVGT